MSELGAVGEGAVRPTGVAGRLAYAWATAIDWWSRRPLGGLLVTLLMAAAAAVLAPGIPFTSDVTAYLPKDSPSVAYWLDLSRRFDAFDALMVGLEEPKAPLTIEGVRNLAAVTARLSELKGQGVLLARSVTNVDSMREGEAGALESELLVPRLPGNEAEREALSRRIAADLQVSGALVSRDQRGYAILLRPDPRRDPVEVARLVERAVEQTRGSLAAYYFGAPFFSALITAKVFAQLYWLVPAFVLVLLAVVLPLVRPRRALVVVLGSTAAALLAWVVLVRVLGLGLSQTSLAALLVLVPVAVAAYARGLEGGARGAAAWPPALAAPLAAISFACLALTQATIAYLAAFGVAIAVGALAVIVMGALVLAPLSAWASPRPAGRAAGGTADRAAAAAGAPARAPSAAGEGRLQRRPRPLIQGLWALAASVVLVAAGLMASRVRFHLGPETMFSPRDEVGRALDFFDRRFGGTDFVQLDFEGDLRDPAVAARLLRLTDLLEGTPGFADVRSVAQVLAFLSHGLTGTHRIPAGAEALQSLWFFLEGSSDVRNLVSDARDEAMVLLRVPAHPAAPLHELVSRIDVAIAASARSGRGEAAMRLDALARAHGYPLEPGRIDAALGAVEAPLTPAARSAADAEVVRRLHAYLSSPDSPYSPTPAEWGALSAALLSDGDTHLERLRAAAESIPTLAQGGLVAQFVDTLLVRERELRRALRVESAAAGLWTPGSPPPVPLRVRAEGVLDELLDPPGPPRVAPQVVVSGLPIVAARIERDLVGGLWRAIAVLLLGGALVLLALTRAPRAALGALVRGAFATALAIGTVGALGLGIDSASATVALLPPLAALVLSAPRSGATLVGGASAAGRSGALAPVLLAGIGLAALTLLAVGVLPVTRLGVAMAAACGAAALVSRGGARARSPVTAG